MTLTLPRVSGAYFTKAIFVPSLSKYSKVTSGSSAIPLEIPSKDLTWQFNLQRVWEKTVHGKGDFRLLFFIIIFFCLQP